MPSIIITNKTCWQIIVHTMSTTANVRNHMNHEELEASRILDLARAGGEVPHSAIVWALIVLGDMKRIWNG
mgnify:CR=1 FL=1